MGLDLRAALRSIARSPGFFLSAALTLALGLGAVVTSFGLLAGKAITEAIATEAANAALAGARPMSGNKYKIQIAKTAVKRAILAASRA